MPLIPVIGRKQPKMRLIVALLYTVLSLGGITMVYPFVVMLGSSFTSTVDKDEFQPLPAYVTDDAWLFKKYVEAKYNESVTRFNIWQCADLATFKDLLPPPDREAPGTKRRVADWSAFRKGLPITHWMLGGITNLAARRVTPENLTRYHEFLQQRYGTLDAVNRAYGQANAVWDNAIPLPEKWDERSFQPMPTRDWREYLEFKRAQAPRFIMVVNGRGLFVEWLRLKYGSGVDDLNRAWGTAYPSRFDVRLPGRLPPGPDASAGRRADWEEFVRKQLPAQFVRLDPGAGRAYQEFLRRKYGKIDLANAAYGARWADFDRIPLPDPPPTTGVPFANWMEFVERAAPVESIAIVTPDLAWRDSLRRQYGSLAALSAAHGTGYASWDDPLPPLIETDWTDMQAEKGPVRGEFLIRNYRDVVNYIILHGPAVWNTFVLCAGLLLVTLIVNPLCAYALSRFNLASTYKILLFLLATMAFPAEVSAIPNFLLLKQFHLLNTYWALILPAMANGYSIFLLKGFFDSLPKELYEAGTIDGASEARMFRVITLPLSRPVLAVIALGTFTAAYGSFIWAFLVCQDPDKWTLMVWLSQLPTQSPMPVIFAALVLAALPTLAVFVFCQNIIMRGIIVPTEK